jgi:transposase-like protein
MTSKTESVELSSYQPRMQAPAGDIDKYLTWAVRDFLQRIMESEMTELLRAKPSERTPVRQGYRSGHRTRYLNTRVGRLQLTIPCERSGRYQSKVFSAYQRSELAFIATLQEMYLQGVSTRRIQKITEDLCGTSFSASTVSRLVAQLDQDLERWRKRRLTEEYLALIVDARYEHVRTNHQVTSQGVLVIIGISAKTGKRDILGVYVANTESRTSWSDVFRDLHQRGLTGVKLVVADAHGGLQEGLARYFQGIPWQRCMCHFKNNLRQLVRPKEQRALLRDVQSIFDAPTLAHARQRLQEVLDQWQPGHEELVNWIEENIEQCLSYFQFPPAWRIRTRTTSMLERYNQELKRRSNVIRIFPNVDSCLRLMTALAMEQAEEWLEQVPYLDMTEQEVPQTQDRICRQFGT